MMPYSECVWTLDDGSPCGERRASPTQVPRDWPVLLCPEHQRQAQRGPSHRTNPGFQAKAQAAYEWSHLWVRERVGR